MPAPRALPFEPVNLRHVLVCARESDGAAAGQRDRAATEDASASRRKARSGPVRAGVAAFDFTVGQRHIAAGPLCSDSAAAALRDAVARRCGTRHIAAFPRGRQGNSKARTAQRRMRRAVCGATGRANQQVMRTSENPSQCGQHAGALRQCAGVNSLPRLLEAHGVEHGMPTEKTTFARQITCGPTAAGRTFDWLLRAERLCPSIAGQWSSFSRGHAAARKRIARKMTPAPFRRCNARNFDPA